MQKNIPLESMKKTVSLAAFAVLVALFSLDCGQENLSRTRFGKPLPKSFSPAPTAHRVVLFSEKQDSVFAADEGLFVQTRRDERRFLEAVKKEFGAAAFFVSEHGKLLATAFPSWGKGHYRWFEKQLFHQKKAEIALKWDDFGGELEFEFRVYGDDRLPMAEKAEVKNWLEKLVRTALKPELIARRPEKNRVWRSGRPTELNEATAANWAFLQQKFDAAMADDTTGGGSDFYLKIDVDALGRGRLGQFDGPPGFEPFLKKWVDSTAWPLLVSRDFGDTLGYSFDEKVAESDAALIKKAIKKTEKCQLQTIRAGEELRIWEEDATGWIAPNSFGNPARLLVVWGEKAHFFSEKSDGQFVAAGELETAGGHASFQDFSFDGLPEIRFESVPNMNGNTFSTLGRWDAAAEKVVFAGRFGTETQPIPAKKQWAEHYSGSWYMPRCETIYGWAAGSLVPIRRVAIALREREMGLPGDCCIVSMYENPLFEKGADSLRLVRRFFDSSDDETIFETHFFSLEKD